MRHGEIVSLTRDQIDLDRQKLLLIDTKNIIDTKNNSPRTVPLTRKAIAVLKEVINHPIRPIDTKYIFFGEPGRNGERKPYAIGIAWKEALDLAGIIELRFHDLRHEATSRFVEAGLSDQEVSSITGHKSMQMLKRYTT